MPRVVLVTGASVGLGLAIARQLLKGPNRLILTARSSSMDRFAEAGITESDQVRLRSLDVTDHAQRTAVIDEANRDWGGVDVLINNAGFAYRAVAEDITDDDIKAQMAVNFRAPMELARLVLPTMRAKKRGHIINISSVGGMMAMPTMGVYAASKFALEGASEALWYEVRPWNIRVSLVQPGFIHSDSFEKVRFTRAGLTNKSRIDQPYYAHYTNMEHLIGRLMGWAFATPEKVARMVVYTMNRRRPPLRVPATCDAWAFAFLKRLLPQRIYNFALYAGLPRIWRWGPKERRVLPLPRRPSSADQQS